MKRGIIDDKGRLFGRINLLDLLAILVVLALVLGVAVKLFVLDSSTAASGSTSFETVVKIEYVRQYTVDALNVGDAIFESDHDGKIGTITGVRTEQGTVVTELADGTLVNVGAEGYFDVYLTIACKGNISNGRYFTNSNYELNANALRGFHTKYASFNASVMELG